VDALWVTLTLLVAGFAGWPVTALVFRLARTIDDKADAGMLSAGKDAKSTDSADDPSADVTVDSTVDGEIIVTSGPGAGSTDGAATADTSTPKDAGDKPASTRILRGGAIIGVLERLAVCLAILGGQPVAIAYVVAIKGLGRFAELKETPVAAERFIIGTLTSMLWAAGVAGVAKILFLS
jgi:hypothetical protein